MFDNIPKLVKANNLTTPPHPPHISLISDEFPRFHPFKHLNLTLVGIKTGDGTQQFPDFADTHYLANDKKVSGVNTFIDAFL